jgi:hypothetical protein
MCSDLSVSDELMGRLKRHFDDDAVIELMGLIVFHNLSSNSALGVQPKGFASCAVWDRRTSGPPEAVWEGRSQFADQRQRGSRAA